MEDELHELRDLVAQLKADNERLRQEQVPVAQPGPSNISLPVVVDPPLIEAGASTAEWFVLWLEIGSAQSLVVGWALALMSGWRRRRLACGFAICLQLIRHFLGGSSERRSEGKDSLLVCKREGGPVANYLNVAADLGCTSLLSHDIPLLDDTAVRQWFWRISPSEYEVVKSHINQLLKAQVIRESCSPYASPIVLVKKKDGSLRLCVDYCRLNSKTRKDAFPLPRIEETLDSLAGARWFSTMDLVSWYNQVPVTEGDKSKTAFCTPFDLFEWNRMPFGLCNAPSTFQRLMERLFGDKQCHSLLSYIDDIVVFSSSVDQHLAWMEVVLSRLQVERRPVLCPSFLVF
ncbi:hypothetical protein QQF64_009468 [Cirrhinus molitorella]|uniref:ribonuclease H n=1 Tax=Cirrhinus molitorella TaxID=172907 RepID=A0ABR3M189_9TELE